MSDEQKTTEQIVAELTAPFDASEIKFKPQSVSGNRALAIPFVDARVVQDRLDDVLGIMGWQDSYECLPDGSVVCRLKVRIGGEWIVKEDVGGQSEQPDEGDRRKAAFSDALKRAAVKFGVGRFLYRMKPQWCDYDPQKRQFTHQPALHLPTASATVHRQEPPQQPAPTPAQPSNGKKDAEKPLTFLDRVTRFEQVAVERNLCKKGEMFAYLMRVLGDKYKCDLNEWPAESWEVINLTCKAFGDGRKPISAEDGAIIEAELKRLGVAWDRVPPKLNHAATEENNQEYTVKEDVKIAELNTFQAKRAIEALRQMPTPAARAEKKKTGK